MAVEAGEFGGAGPGDGGFEAGGLRDDEVGGDAAVGPAADAKFAGIGDSLLDGVVNHGHVVLEVFVAPLGEDGFGVVLAVAGGAAGVAERGRRSRWRRELGEVGELGVVSPDRAAVGPENSWSLLARSVIEGFVEVTGDLGAVFAFEVNVFAVGELELGEESVVDVGELGELAAGDGEEFVGTIDGGNLSDYGRRWG